MNRRALESLSIVIPVGPGETAWRELLPCLGELTPETEVILAATTPPPEAPAVLARQAGLTAELRWLVSRPGRALQMNAGAAAATRQWLWFLHADCRPDPAALEALGRFIALSGDERIGYFDLRFQPDGPWLVCLNALGANLRSRTMGLPFGDQGFCFARNCFERLGGFDERLVLGEDLDLILRARHLGIAARPVGAALHASARRYRAEGWLRATARHRLLTWRLSRQARKRLGESPG